MIYLTKYNIDLSKYGIDLSDYCKCDKQYTRVQYCTICHKKRMSIVEYIEHLETIAQQISTPAVIKLKVNKPTKLDFVSVEDENGFINSDNS